MRVSLLLLVAACSVQTGNGKRARSLRQVPAFDEVEVSGALDAELGPGPQDVEIAGDENLLELVTTKVEGHRLVIGEQHGIIRPKLGLVVTVHAPALHRVLLSGAGKATLHGMAGDELELDLGGAGTLTADGAVHHVKVNVSGAGTVEASKLTAERADAEISGAGTADVFASQSLAAHVSGAGSIHYDGHPAHVTKDVSGAGSIAPR